MKIFRYLDRQQQAHYGALHSQGEHYRLIGDLFTGLRFTNQVADIQQWLPPLQPVSINCIGLNYGPHAQEMNAKPSDWPVTFYKPISAVTAHQQAIQIPTHLASQQVDYEIELAVVIGKTCKNVSVDQALDYVIGYTIANDVTARDWQLQHGGGQWCRGKAFDSFCPLGPYLVTTDSIPDPQQLHLETRVNGEVLQSAHTSDMMFSVAEIISYLSGSTTLLAGTVILTGTPEGIGMARQPQRWLQPGDIVEVSIENIGTLRNPVVLESSL